MPRRPSTRTLNVVNNTMNNYISASGGSAIIQSVTMANDGAGGVSETVTTLGTVAAFVRPSRVGQIDTAGQAIAEKVEFIMALGTTIAVDLKYRVVYSGSTYEVRDVDYNDGVTWADFQSVRVVRIV